MNSKPNLEPSDLSIANELRERMGAVMSAISQKVVGQRETLEQLLVALLAGGTACWKVSLVWPKP